MYRWKVFHQGMFALCTSVATFCYQKRRATIYALAEMNSYLFIIIDGIVGWLLFSWSRLQAPGKVGKLLQRALRSVLIDP